MIDAEPSITDPNALRVYTAALVAIAVRSPLLSQPCSRRRRGEIRKQEGIAAGADAVVAAAHDGTRFEAAPRSRLGPCTTVGVRPTADAHLTADPSGDGFVFHAISLDDVM